MSEQWELGQLEKLRILGEGTYGKCYLVQHKHNNELCVLKQIEIFGMSEQEQEEVVKEARILSLLDHPHIIRFLAFFKTDSYLNIVMEYADGGDLSQHIRDAKGAPFPEPRILDIFAQMCLAIKHIHDRKIIHRDLKCQNIFMTKEGLVKLGDFGIAKHLSKTLEKRKTVVGTPYYMSPEICESKDYSYKTDIWSLGVILYQMCALKLPFDGGSLPVLALKISRGEYPAITGNYSKQLKMLVKNLLQNNPAKRPSVSKILENALLQKYLPKQPRSNLSGFGIQCHELEDSLKDNDQGNKMEPDGDRKGEINSARTHIPNNVKVVKTPHSKPNQISARLREFSAIAKSGKNQKEKKKKVESLKRREISEPNLAARKFTYRNEHIEQVREDDDEEKQEAPETPETLEQTLTSVLKSCKNPQPPKAMEEIDDNGGLYGESFAGYGLACLLWGLRHAHLKK